MWSRIFLRASRNPSSFNFETVRAMSKVCVFYGPEAQPRTKVQPHSLPGDLEKGEILTKVCLATICGSDLHTISGKRKEPIPGVLGHEAVVKIVDSRREGFSVGERVSFTVADSCNDCHMCKIGIPQKCKKLFKYGHCLLDDKSGFNGCYASHVLIRSGTHVTKIPPHLSDDTVAPANCSLATAVCAVHRIPESERPNQIAVVQGDGLLGLYTCALLHDQMVGNQRKYETIYCVGHSEQRLKLSKEFGATPLNERDFLKDGPDPNTVDVVIEACGTSAAIKDGVRVVRPGGTYVLMGLVHPNSELGISAEQLIRKCLTLIGVHNYAGRDLDASIDFLARTADEYPFGKLVGAIYSLDKFEEAVDVAMSKKHIRVGVIPGGDPQTEQIM